jgi:hypothetical protein
VKDEQGRSTAPRTFGIQHIFETRAHKMMQIGKFQARFWEG